MKQNSSSNVEPPKLVLIAGATGVGKSTISIDVARKLKFSRCISTDSIREILRTVSTQKENPNLFKSSFSKGETGNPLNDWKDSCDPINPGIKATIQRARREGIDLILEGVHIVPSNEFLREWTNEGGIAVGVVLHVKNKHKHLELIEEREKNSWRTAQRYIESFDRIREIQEGILESAIPYSWNSIDPTKENASEKIEHLLDLEWNKYNSS